jgi:hypothetical protein
MKLISAQVQKFRNFDDSEAVAIEPDVTALVGKNESGKTAFLQGPHRLNPHDGAALHELADYPRWLYTKDRRADRIAGTTAVEARFELEEADRTALAAKFGADVVRASVVTIGLRYNGEYWVNLDVDLDEAAAVAHHMAGLGLPEGLTKQLGAPTTFAALKAGHREAGAPRR